MTSAVETPVSQSSSQEAMPEMIDSVIPAYQRAQMALTLASLFCQERGAALIGSDGQPSQQVTAVASVLLS